MNGGLNLSVLDGWWPEGFDGGNGWAIGDTRDWEDTAGPKGHEAQDAADAESLYSTLESQVIPTFRDRDAWAKMSAHAIASCMPRFNTDRMVWDYLGRMYRS
jgi:starch phosphorylase